MPWYAWIALVYLVLMAAAEVSMAWYWFLVGWAVLCLILILVFHLTGYLKGRYY